MKIIQNTVNLNFKLNTSHPEDEVCFFDIETTGLSRDYNSIYLIGILYKDEQKDSWMIEQYFAESLAEEPEVIESFLSRCRLFKYVYTYNGDSFDIPFVRKRAEKFGISWELVNSFDIYRYVKENRLYLDLPDMKLKTLEKYLGIDRKDTISGKECIDLYKSYLRDKNKESERLILGHNYDDLQYMPLILDIRDIVDNNRSIHIDQKARLFIEKIDFIGDRIKVEGRHMSNLETPCIYFKPSYSMKIATDNFFYMEMETMNVSVTGELTGVIAVTSSLDHSESIIDQSPFETPPGVLLLKAGGELFTDNIKQLIEMVYRQSTH